MEVETLQRPFKFSLIRNFVTEKHFSRPLRLKGNAYLVALKVAKTLTYTNKIVA